MEVRLTKWLSLSSGDSRPPLKQRLNMGIGKDDNPQCYLINSRLSLIKKREGGREKWSASRAHFTNSLVQITNLILWKILEFSKPSFWVVIIIIFFIQIGVLILQPAVKINYVCKEVNSSRCVTIAGSCSLVWVRFDSVQTWKPAVLF